VRSSLPYQRIRSLRCSVPRPRLGHLDTESLGEPPCQATSPVLYAAFAIAALSSAFLFVYGANLLYLSWRAVALGPAPARPPPGPSRQEHVVVQLPIYNERYVAERVIEAVAALDWPRDLLHVQVLDDSDDDTPDIVAAAVACWRSAGVDIHHVRRNSRAGYKAGALAHGLTLTDAPFVAVFDADFVPPRDFLRQMLPAFEDPKVGFVQARWGHLNEEFSLFTYVQSLMSDFHFLVEQSVRLRHRYLMNFNGSAGVWRRTTIEDAGGWSGRTLTEDLDLSYRAQLRGWRPAYREDVVVPQELPVSVNAYRGQQSRWATGSLQCAIGLLPNVLRSRLRPAAKFQATMHLLGYVAPLAMLTQIACYPALLLARDSFHALPALGVPVVASLLSLAPAISMAVAQWRRGRDWWWHWFGLIGWTFLGAGTSATVAAAVLPALRGGGEFKRTPKYHIERLGEDWRSKVYFKPNDLGAVRELVAGAAAGVLAWQAALLDQGLLALYSGLFGLGFLYLAGLSFVQALRQVRYEQVLVRLRVFLPRLHAPALVGFAGLALLAVARIPDPFEDSYQHWLIAANLATTGRLQDPLFQMQDTWLPAYHLLAALVLKVLGTWQLGALKVVNVGLGLATLCVVYRLAGTRRRGLTAVGLLGLNPIFLLTTTTVVAEPLLVLGLVGAMLAASRHRFGLAALLACLACLTGTKAWLWLACVALVWLVAAAPRARWLTSGWRWAWLAPALALAVVLQGAFGFASHSVARAAAEVTSATGRGSVSAGALARTGQFLGYFALASIPTVALLPLGLAKTLPTRGGGGPSWPEGGTSNRLLLLVAVPSVLYLVAVTALVGAGVYSGSHRYYYPALPGLALLAAAAADRLRMPVALVPVGAAAVLAALFVPVFTALANDNRGLQAAGADTAAMPGALLTDSPAAAYFSHKPPSEIHGSRELPGDRADLLAWLKARDVRGVVLEDIDYYRAHTVLPDLLAGQSGPPFVTVGSQARYTVPGGKRVLVYEMGPAPMTVNGTSVGIDAVATRPAHGKTAELAKGPVLLSGGQDVAGDGLGFGVPLARFDDGWWFAGPDSTLSIGPGGRSWTRVFVLDRHEVDDAGGHFVRFEAGPSHGSVRVTYTMRSRGIEVLVQRLQMAAGLQRLVIANEESAAFDDYADRRTPGGATVGSMSPVQGDYARFRSAQLGMEWGVPSPPPGWQFFAEREQRPPSIDFSGLEWVSGPDFTSVDYLITIGRQG
jgi:cellulose synthase/poly-beta-1,6-N-acetylglucosamine synthase-like glycosyltransferase